MDEINKIKSFLSQNTIKKINIENWRQYFEYTTIKDLSNNKIINLILEEGYKDKEKLLKLIQILLEDGANANEKDEMGYSIVHQVLYGDHNENPYETIFIKKLIQLLMEYNFNVNIVDADKDTIIHTAIASECYFGSIVELLDTLGSNFDIQNKDNHGNNIYEALLFYKEEAAQTKNKQWYDKLVLEENLIKQRIEQVNINEETSKNEKVNSKKKSTKNFENNTNKKNNAEMKTISNTPTVEQNNAERKTADVNNPDLIEDTSKNLSEQLEKAIPSNKDLKNLNFFKSLLTLLNNMNGELLEEDILKIKSQIDTAQTLEQLNILQNKISYFPLNDDISHLLDLINEKTQIFYNRILKINQLITYISPQVIMNIFLQNANYYTMSLEEFDHLEKLLLEKIIKTDIENSIIQINNHIDKVLLYANSDIFTEEFLWNKIDEAIQKKKNKRRI